MQDFNPLLKSQFFFSCFRHLQWLSHIRWQHTLIQQPPTRYHVHSLEPGALPQPLYFPSRSWSCSAGMVISSGFCLCSGKSLDHLLGTQAPKLLADVAPTSQGISASALLQQVWQFFLVSATAEPASVSHQAVTQRHRRQMFLPSQFRQAESKQVVSGCYSLQWNSTLDFDLQPSLSLDLRHPLRELVNENELNNSHQAAHRAVLSFY